MSAIPDGVINTTAESVDQANITQVLVDAEIRAKSDNSDNKVSEQIRWIVTATVEAVVCTVTNIDLNTTTVTQRNLQGVFNGSADAVNLQLDSGYFKSTDWRLIHDEIVALNGDGSEQYRRSQKWLGISEWTDAPWND